MKARSLLASFLQRQEWTLDRFNSKGLLPGPNGRPSNPPFQSRKRWTPSLIHSPFHTDKLERTVTEVSSIGSVQLGTRYGTSLLATRE